MHCDTTQFCDFTNFFYDKKKEAEKQLGLALNGANRNYEFAQKVQRLAYSISFKNDVGRNAFEFEQFQKEFSKLCEEWNEERGYYIFNDALPKIYEYIGKAISVGENSRLIGEEYKEKA